MKKVYEPVRNTERVNCTCTNYLLWEKQRKKMFKDDLKRQVGEIRETRKLAQSREQQMTCRALPQHKAEMKRNRHEK